VKKQPEERDPKLRELIDYYSTGEEAERLSLAAGPLEFERTMEILGRYLPQPLAVVLDVGGACGPYTCWLLERGYEAHLIDPVPLHVERAREAIAGLPDHPPAGAEVGDALKLERDDESADAVLFMGPLYHLTERDDRLAALREARRVLRPGGVMFAVGISRFASLMDGLNRGILDDPDFVEIIRGDLRDGQHRNPTGRWDYFTSGFFHHPDELEAEVREAGFRVEALLGIEGPAWALKDFDKCWEEPEQCELLLEIIRKVESEKSLLGISPHLMVVALKKF